MKSPHLVAAATVAVTAALAPAAIVQTYFAEAINIDPADWNGGAPLPSSSNFAELQGVADAQAAFLANFSQHYHADFESTPLGNPGPGGTTLTFSGPDGPFTAMLDGPGEVRTSPPGTNSRFATSGVRYYDTQANPNDPIDSSPPFTVSFSGSGITDFGFYATDVGDFGGQIELRLNDATVSVITIPNTVGSGGDTDPSILFFGFISDQPFNEIRFTSTATDADGFGFDDMIFGRSGAVPLVPLPSASIMALAASVGLAARRRRS